MYFFQLVRLSSICIYFTYTLMRKCLKPIYSNHDLGHYCALQVALVLRLVIEIAQVLFPDLAARVSFELKPMSKPIKRISIQWYVFMKKI